MKDEIARFKSLSEVTARFLSPMKLHESDRLHVSLDDKGTSFITRAYGEKHLCGEICTLTRVKRGFASRAATNKWVERVPETRRMAGYAETKMPTTDTVALLMNALWPWEQLIFDDDALVVYEYLLMRFARQSRASVDRARFTQDGDNGEFPLLDREDVPLADYQRMALKSSMWQEGVALFMEQGTGKSAVVVSRICNESLKSDGLYRALIVCPKNVRTNWRDEFVKFATTDGKLVVLRGGKLERIKQLIEAHADDENCGWVTVVCSYESITTTWDAIGLCEWDLCVLDESHFIKSTYTKRYKQMMLLRDRCRQRMCLTGTPVTNTPFDLFPQFEFLGEGLSGFSTFNAFRTFYGKWARLPDGRMTLSGVQNVPLLKERLARLSVIIKKADALPHLPEKLYDVCEVEMTKEQGRAYSSLARHLVAEIENDLGSGTPRQIVVRNALTKLLRLAQITSGFAVTSDPNAFVEGEPVKNEITHFDPNPKLEELVEILREKSQREKTVVWACWVQDIKSIRGRLKLEEIDCVTYYGQTSDNDRDKAVKRFNSDPRCRVFVGNPAAGGTGLNLFGHSKEEDDHDCTHVIYYSQDWSMVYRAQSEDRSHRRGTRRHVRYTDLVVLGSIDEEIRNRVMDKRVRALEIQDLKEILQGLL